MTEAFFEISRPQNVIRPGFTRDDRCAQWVTLSGEAGSFSKGQISDQKNRLATASISSHPRDLGISLLLQCFPVSLASYCVTLCPVPGRGEQRCCSYWRLKLTGNHAPTRYLVNLTTVIKSPIVHSIHQTLLIRVHVVPYGPCLQHIAPSCQLSTKLEPITWSKRQRTYNEHCHC